MPEAKDRRIFGRSSGSADFLFLYLAEAPVQPDLQTCGRRQHYILPLVMCKEYIFV